MRIANKVREDLVSAWYKRIREGLNNLRGRGVRTLAENFFSLSVLQAANYLLPLIVLPYLVRVLGVEKFGLVVFAQAFIQFFVIATDFGFNLSAPREIALNKDNADRVSGIFCSAMVTKLALMVIGFVVLCCVVSFFGRFRSEALLYLLTYGIVVGNVLYPVWFFQGMEKMKYSALLNISAKVIFLILIFVFVTEEEHYVRVPVMNSLGFIVAGIVSLWLVVRKFRVVLRFPKRAVLLEQIRMSSQFFLSRISVSVYSNFNAFILGLLTDNVTVGYYAAAEKLFIAMRTAFVPLVQSLYPYMSARRDRLLFKKIFYSSIVLAIIGSALAAVFSREITQLVFGPGYEPSAGILRMFSLIVPVVAASVLLGYPFLAAMGHEKYANFSIAIGSLCHLLFISLLAPVISMHLVVGVTMLTETIILGVRVYAVRKHRLWGVA